MADEFKYHLPIGNRSYRIQRSSGVNAYLQRCWPHHQHRFLAYMCFKSLSDDVEIITQKELIDTFNLNKGVVSATIKKMLRRKHIEQISNNRPFWYRLTLEGEQFARYVFTHFPKYQLDIVQYFVEEKVQYDNLPCIDEGRSLLEKMEGIHGPTNKLIGIKVRVSELSREIPVEFSRLFMKFGKMKDDDKDEMFRSRNCDDMTRMYRLLDEEIRIRYLLTNLLKASELLLETKKNPDRHDRVIEMENKIFDFLLEDYSEPSYRDGSVKPMIKETVQTDDQGSSWDWGISFLKDLRSIMELVPANEERSSDLKPEDRSIMDQRLRMTSLDLKRSKRRRRNR